MTDTELRVNSIYADFQWEGQAMGRHGLFIRLQGCPNSCFNCPHSPYPGALAPSCDPVGEEVTVDQMLDKDSFKTNTYAVLTSEQLMAIVWDFIEPPNDIIITGGEPAAQNLLELTALLVANDYDPIVHTGGERPFEVYSGTQISVRPRTRLTMPQALNVANEVIFIINDLSDLAWLDILMEHIDDTETEVFVQARTRTAFESCKEVAPMRGFRISYSPSSALE
jgi:organic radical activating enzyme